MKRSRNNRAIILFLASGVVAFAPSLSFSININVARTLEARAKLAQARQACKRNYDFSNQSEALNALTELCNSSLEEGSAAVGQVLAIENTASNQITSDAAKKTINNQIEAAAASQELSEDGKIMSERVARAKLETSTLFREKAERMSALIKKARAEAKERQQQSELLEEAGKDEEAQVLYSEGMMLESYAAKMETDVKPLLDSQATAFHAGTLGNINSAQIMGSNAAVALQGVNALSSISGSNNRNSVPDKVVDGGSANRYETKSARNTSNASVASPSPFLGAGKSDSSGSFAGKPFGSSSLTTGKDEKSTTASLSNKETSKESKVAGSSMGGIVANTSSPENPASTENTKQIEAATSAGTMDGGGGVPSNLGSSDLGLSIAMNSDPIDFSNLLGGILEPENTSEQNSEDLTQQRTLASEVDSNGATLPGGVLNQGSGTLFKRVNNAYSRLLKGGRVLNGLNAKI